MTASSRSRPVQDKQVELRGLNLHFRDWGGEGPPLVLLHGLASNCRIWDLAAPKLTDRFSVYALDQRGHGKTGGPDDGYDFESICSDLHAFCQHLGLERPLLAGHSWGGNVVLQYAVDYPNHTAGIVMVDGGTIEVASMPGMNWQNAQVRMAPPDFSDMTWDGLLERVKGGDLGALWSPEVEEFFRANFEIGPAGEVSPYLTREHHMQCVRALWEHKPSQLFRRVGAPVLIVPAWREPKSDREALFTNSKVKLVNMARDMLEDCEVLWMENSIHDIPLQRPQELAEAIIAFADGGRG